MVILGLTTIISTGTTQYLFGVLVLPMSQTLGWSQTHLANAYALSLVIAGIFGVPIGHLVDRWGARFLMTIGSFLGGISLIGISQVHTMFIFYLWWSLGLGLAMALTFYPVSFTVMTNWFEQKRGTALAILTLVGGLASPLFIPSEGWMVMHFGWRSMLLIVGGVQLMVAMPLHGLFLRRHPEDLGLAPDGATLSISGHLPGMTRQEAFHLPAFWLLTLAISLTMFGSTIVLVYQISALIVCGYDPVMATIVAGALGFASLPGRVACNLLSERISPQKILCGSILAQAVGLICLIIAPSLGWLIVYVVFYGAAYGTIPPLRAAVMAEHMGRRSYGFILAWQGIVVAFSSGMGALAAGWIYNALHTYTISFWFCVGAFLLAACCLALTPRPPRPRVPC
ncbi:putative MFS-type transporter YbfB [Ktedonobacteria bacterium brp13]|nr:putative MFS-type transporter YbfB [Ktedonobacteria bacterium brp13]